MRPTTAIRSVSLACALLLGGVAAPAQADEREITASLRRNLDTIVVIYAENRAFDNVYGNFPGARGLGEVAGEAAPAAADVQNLLSGRNE